jgi:hypothetical protein
MPAARSLVGTSVQARRFVSEARAKANELLSWIFKIGGSATRGMWDGCRVSVVQRHCDNCYCPTILDLMMNHSRLFATSNEVIIHGSRVAGVGREKGHVSLRPVDDTR